MKSVSKILVAGAVYESPVCECVDVRFDGILCDSAGDGSLTDYSFNDQTDLW